MAKINLKTASPLPEPEKSEKTKTIREQEHKKPQVTEENEFQETISTEEPVEQTIQSEDGDTFTFEAVEEPKKPAGAKAKKMRFRENGLSDLSGETDQKWGGNSTGGWKKFIVLAGILLVSIIAGYALYQYSGIFNNLPFLKKKAAVKQAPVERQAPVSEPAAGRLTAVFQKNLGINSYLNASLQQIISNKSSAVRLALIVITPGEINITVFSDATDKIARYKNDLNKSLPNLNFTTLSSQTKMINRTQMVFVDLSTKIAPSLLPTSSATVTTVNPPASFDKEIGSLSKKYRVTLNYLKAGKVIDTAQFQTNHFYLNVNGKKEGILNFITDISTSFPAAQITKMALNPSNLATYSDSYLSARINISYINPK